VTTNTDSQPGHLVQLRTVYQDRLIGRFPIPVHTLRSNAAAGAKCDYLGRV
jgi:hypothetical protein